MNMAVAGNAYINYEDCTVSVTGGGIKRGETITVSYTYPLDPHGWMTPVQKAIKARYPDPRPDRYSRRKGKRNGY
jgi:hypothetical protein